ncbi:hypothetical protein MP11Mi_35130 [Gordonia sp. MP11Mi]|uniref:Uncharacterized protein n=1 Tax=Gordonia sp. MP11Mi TaxID=3022769 RepID=A0AA97CXY7_9ACTN
MVGNSAAVLGRSGCNTVCRLVTVAGSTGFPEPSAQSCRSVDQKNGMARTARVHPRRRRARPPRNEEEDARGTVVEPEDDLAAVEVSQVFRYQRDRHRDGDRIRRHVVSKPLDFLLPPQSLLSANLRAEFLLGLSGSVPPEKVNVVARVEDELGERRV